MKEKNIRIFLKNGFRYEGELVNETEKFVTIKDTKTNKVIDIAVDNISVREHNG